MACHPMLLPAAGVATAKPHPPQWNPSTSPSCPFLEGQQYILLFRSRQCLPRDIFLAQGSLECWIITWGVWRWISPQVSEGWELSDLVHTKARCQGGTESGTQQGCDPAEKWQGGCYSGMIGSGRAGKENQTLCQHSFCQNLTKLHQCLYFWRNPSLPRDAQVNSLLNSTRDLFWFPCQRAKPSFHTVNTSHMAAEGCLNSVTGYRFPDALPWTNLNSIQV